MLNFFIKRSKNEDGAVLITSLLFLMIVTVLAIIGIQSPKTDIMISGNEKLLVQSQQLANMGVMEAKSWLTLHYKSDAIPLNAVGKEDDTGDLKYFVVVRPTTTNADSTKDIDTLFSRAGVLNKSELTITEPVPVAPETALTYNTGTTVTKDVFSKTISADDYTLKDSSGNELATYEWNIVRLSSVVSSGGEVINEISDSSLTSYISSLSNSLADKFNNRTPITEAESVAIDDSTAFWLYFHIEAEANSNGLIAQTEAVVSYKQVVPSPN